MNPRDIVQILRPWQWSKNGIIFAGLIFSRDPEAVHVDASFGPIHDLLVPFFFIGIGFQVEPGLWGAALTPGLVLLAAAVLGKLETEANKTLKPY